MPQFSPGSGSKMHLPHRNDNFRRTSLFTKVFFRNKKRELDQWSSLQNEAVSGSARPRFMIAGMNQNDENSDVLGRDRLCVGVHAASSCPFECAITASWDLKIMSPQTESLSHCGWPIVLRYGGSIERKEEDRSGEEDFVTWLICSTEWAQGQRINLFPVLFIAPVRCSLVKKPSGLQKATLKFTWEARRWYPRNWLLSILFSVKSM